MKCHNLRKIDNVGLELLTAVLLNIEVFWDVTLRRLVNVTDVSKYLKLLGPELFFF